MKFSKIIILIILIIVGVFIVKKTVNNDKAEITIETKEQKVDQSKNDNLEKSAEKIGG